MSHFDPDFDDCDHEAYIDQFDDDPNPYAGTYSEGANDFEPYDGLPDGMGPDGE